MRLLKARGRIVLSRSTLLQRLVPATYEKTRMAETATIICPKCRGEMRTYERNGVVVDQCEECRGIFLDRGGLE
jgi:hypothetical protein